MKRNTFGRMAIGTAMLATAALGLAVPASTSVAEDARPSCNMADFAPEFGVLDLYDVVMFIHLFEVQAQPADLDGNDIFDLADIVLFVDAFNAGCAS